MVEQAFADRDGRQLLDRDAVDIVGGALAGRAGQFQGLATDQGRLFVILDSGEVFAVKSCDLVFRSRKAQRRQLEQ